MADKIEIFPYDPAWPLLFAQLGATLRQALGHVALRIDHIGPTSVPGLDAKPVIDVQIAVVSLAPLDAFRVPLTQLGYVFRAENPELTKRYFREAGGQRRTHIHVRKEGSWAQQFALLFRDYMRTHPHDARRYAEVKYGLATQYGHDRQGYTEAKTPFIWETMLKADRWSQVVGWEPGPSDA